MDGAVLDADDQIEARVVAILAAQALRDPDGLTPAMTLESLGIDSLGMAEILFAIEESFDIVVPFNANTPEAGAGFALDTVGGVCAGVVALVRAGRG